jgi:hypothetical protein
MDSRATTLCHLRVRVGKAKHASLAVLIATAGCVLPHANPRGGADVVSLDGTIDDQSVTPEDTLDANELDNYDVFAMDADIVSDGQDVKIDATAVDAIDGSDASDVMATDVTDGGDTGACPAQMVDCGGGCRRVDAVISTCRDAMNDGVYGLTVGGTLWCATCRSIGNGERWTMILRANGAAGESPQPQRFGYDSALWTNEETYNPAAVTLDEHDYKARGFMVLPFKEILIQMWTPTDSMMPRTLTGTLVDRMGTPVASLRSIFLNAGRQYSMLWTDRDLLGLVPNSSLQPWCRRTGFNTRANDNGRARVRIGAIGNENVIDSCDTHDSWIGVGGWLGDNQSFSAGNVVESCLGCEQVTRSRAVVWLR